VYELLAVLRSSPCRHVTPDCDDLIEPTDRLRRQHGVIVDTFARRSLNRPGTHVNASDISIFTPDTA
jgi:hypothetical protein